jgi:hypothetical protein
MPRLSSLIHAVIPLACTLGTRLLDVLRVLCPVILVSPLTPQRSTGSTCVQLVLPCAGGTGLTLTRGVPGP